MPDDLTRARAALIAWVATLSALAGRASPGTSGPTSHRPDTPLPERKPPADGADRP